MKNKILLILPTLTFACAIPVLAQEGSPAMSGAAVTTTETSVTATNATIEANSDKANAIARGKVVAMDATGDILRASSGDEGSPDTYTGAAAAAFFDMAGRPMTGEAKSGAVGQTAKLTYRFSTTVDPGKPPVRELTKVELVEPMPETVVITPQGATQSSGSAMEPAATGSAASAPGNLPGPAVVGEATSGIAPRNQPAHDPEKSATAISAASDGDITTSSDENAATDGDRTTVAEPSSSTRR